jgi:hypothetical protein
MLLLLMPLAMVVVVVSVAASVFELLKSAAAEASNGQVL